jgi:hypothetical protein
MRGQRYRAPVRSLGSFGARDRMLPDAAAALDEPLRTGHPRNILKPDIPSSISMIAYWSRLLAGLRVPAITGRSKPMHVDVF